MKSNNSRSTAFLTYVVAAGLSGAAAGAQAQTANSSTAGADAVLQEIVVTAFKQGAQNIQDVPSSLEVLGSERLEAMGVTNFADFSRSVPGLNFVDSGPGDKRYIIRGINSAGEAQTALYIDNVPLTGLGGAATDFGGSQADLDLTGFVL